MDGVPMKTPQAATVQEVKDDVKVKESNYLTILQETEYEFSLENWVLTGLQSGFTTHQRPQPSSSSSSGLQPSCPPYWMIFSSPQQSCLASHPSSDFWEPSPRQRSRSLSPVVLHSKFRMSVSDEEEEGLTQEPKTSVLSEEKRPDVLCKAGQKKVQRAFVPDLLNPPACLSSLPHQRRKNLRQCSLSGIDGSTHHSPNRSSSSSQRAPDTRVTVGDHTMHLRQNSCGSPPAPPPNQSLNSSVSDCSAELFSALSPEEKELLGAITARGYPLHTAIIALQRTGRQTPEKILRYLVARDHLCQLGYDTVQVEEALEMFQNCETKAEEFLHLLSQFIEMGFQQNTIKEVLLVHENHLEQALEELMMRVA
ncbi:uncharacterized protein ubap1lb [Pholidichthys leucotaenia]